MENFELDFEGEIETFDKNVEKIGQGDPDTIWGLEDNEVKLYDEDQEEDIQEKTDVIDYLTNNEYEEYYIHHSRLIQELSDPLLLKGLTPEQEVLYLLQQMENLIRQVKDEFKAKNVLSPVQHSKLCYVAGARFRLGEIYKYGLLKPL